MKRLLPFTLLLPLVTAINCLGFSGAMFSSAMLEKAKRAVVLVENSPNKEIVGSVRSNALFASGAVLDKKNGWIVTNSHVACSSNINNIKVTMFNGQKLNAKFVYDDPSHDIAFLKVENTEEIPLQTEQVAISAEWLKAGAPVAIVSNNEGQAFSVQTGTISGSTSVLSGTQNYTISLNTKGGSSGAPVLNAKGEMVALNFASGDTFAHAICAQYVTEAASYIFAGKTPPRHSIGVVVDYMPLDTFVRRNALPVAQMKKYLAKNPQSMNRGLVVVSVSSTSPSTESLMLGDVLWSVNGQEIDGGLYKLQQQINNAPGSIKLTVYRAGQLKHLNVPTVNLQMRSKDKFVVFCGSIFYMSDKLEEWKFGVPHMSLMVTNVDRHGCFKSLPYAITGPGGAYNGSSQVRILSFNNQKVSTLEELVAAIPGLIKQKEFTVEFVNHSIEYGLSGAVYEPRMPEFLEIEYSDESDVPQSFALNAATNTWTSRAIAK